MKAKLDILALVLGFIGLVGTVTITALPTWRVSAFIGANIVVMEDLWEGLWMNCWRQANIRMQCKMYESMLILPPELQAARGLTCVSIILVVLALLITGFGSRKSNCCDDNIRSKNTILALGGCLYLLSFLTTIIPVSWVGSTVISNFYNPLVLEGRKRELGSALFIGWATSGILLITGIIVLFSYNKHRAKDEDPYYTGTPLVPLRNPSQYGSDYLKRTPSTSHKNHQYV
ncbi:claudin-17-like [Paralichthys olivaceus]|uniref:claudin-17-like n=1 Tax=Paralichthys olivaceus TaxID=8255 RepID=UPI00097D19EC|nr:PREDICTED: claudin-17-like [Paralichthys olivaceus]